MTRTLRPHQICRSLFSGKPLGHATPRFAALAAGLALLPGLLPDVSHASDGVLELNQTCAIITGCTRDDDPGFPISISGGDGRSYVLTSNLLIGDANTSGIVIDASADGVSIDLNGFSIRGVTSCTGGGQDISCSPTGAGQGIRSNAEQAHVHNGHIVGMGRSGIDVRGRSLIEGVTVSESGFYGFTVGEGTVVRHSTSTRNGLIGFNLATGSVASDCTSSLNGSDGYRLFPSSHVRQSSASFNGGSGFDSYGFPGAILHGNTAHHNGEHGISAGGHTTIRKNTLRNNTLTGISANKGSVIEGNTVGGSGTVGINAAEASVINNNAVTDSAEGGIVAGVGAVIRGNSVYSNGTNLSHDGIHCSLGCRVKDNTLRANAGFGIRFDSNSSGYSDNTIGANGAGTVSLGRDTGANVCGTSTTCP